MPIRIKREDGSCTEYRNARLIPAFLMIPEDLLRRCGKTLYELPRTRTALLDDRAVIRQVESDLFLECIVDAYAYMAWPHMGLKGRLEDYSGYNPCWRVAHAAPLWIDELNDLGLLYTFPQWLEATELQPTTPFGFVPYETVDKFLSIAVPSVMQRDGYAVWLNYVQKHPCFEDFDEHRYSWQKADFIKKWYHTRTKHPTTLSREVLRIHEIVDGAEAGLLHSNEHSEFENEIDAQIDAERFLQTLSETDQKILALRLKGRKMHPRGRVRGKEKIPVRLHIVVGAHVKRTVLLAQNKLLPIVRFERCKCNPRHSLPPVILSVAFFASTRSPPLAQTALQPCKSSLHRRLCSW